MHIFSHPNEKIGSPFVPERSVFKVVAPKKEKENSNLISKGVFCVVVRGSRFVCSKKNFKCDFNATGNPDGLLLEIRLRKIAVRSVVFDLIPIE
jgi:hypothetical protein